MLIPSLDFGPIVTVIAVFGVAIICLRISVLHAREHVRQRTRRILAEARMRIEQDPGTRST
jgi:hypothetical protein